MLRLFINQIILYTGRVVCGTSGQPIADILQYTSISSPMEALKATLKWGHMAPTAPDTLPCMPTETADPFIIQNRPHVYFTGNCDKFESDVFEGILYILK